MDKTLKDKQPEAEIIPPKKTGQSDADDPLQQEGHNLQTRLVTTGQIKSELGKMYRLVRNGKLDPGTAYACRGILQAMLKATEQEHLFQLAADDPDDDTPSLTGVVIIGPGAPAKRLRYLGRQVSNEAASTRTKGKSK